MKKKLKTWKLLSLVTGQAYLNLLYESIIDLSLLTALCDK